MVGTSVMYTDGGMVNTINEEHMNVMYTDALVVNKMQQFLEATHHGLAI